MQNIQRFIDAFKRCDSLQAVSSLIDSSYCLLRSEGLSRLEGIDVMKRIQSALHDEEPTQILVFADIRIEKMIGSMVPRGKRRSPVVLGF